MRSASCSALARTMSPRGRKKSRAALALQRQERPNSRTELGPQSGTFTVHCTISFTVYRARGRERDARGSRHGHPNSQLGTRYSVLRVTL